MFALSPTVWLFRTMESGGGHQVTKWPLAPLNQGVSCDASCMPIMVGSEKESKLRWSPHEAVHRKSFQPRVLFE